MKILAFDTSTQFLSISLLDDGKEVSVFHKNVGIRHSEVLAGVMRDMLDDVGWKMKDIELVAVGLGPGSLTGIRIGAAAAKGLAAATGAPVMGIPSMDAMVMNFPLQKKEKLVPFMDARKGKVYACIYDRSGMLPVKESDHMLLPADELLAGIKEDSLFFGDAVSKYRDEIKAHPHVFVEEDADWYPRAFHIGHIALERFPDGAGDPVDLEPLYMHDKECNITKRDQ